MAGSLVIAAARVIAEQGDLTPGIVEVDRGRIVRVRAGRPPRGVRVLGGVLAPGLIDLQINGCAGVDFATLGDPADLDKVHRFLLGTGVTGYLPTLISTPLPQLREALRRWQEAAREDSATQARSVPRILGVHVEGPYLNPVFAGAHPKQYLRVNVSIF